MHLSYIEILSRKFPAVEVSCIGDSYVYENLDWGSTTPISQAELDNDRLQISQNDKWSAIKAERDKRKIGGVKVGAFWFHSDDPSRIQQIALTMLGANIPAGLQWKTMTGEFTTMTQTLANQIFQTSIGSDQNIFSIAETHRQNMMASADPEAYDFSTGWPITYAESPEYVGVA